MKCDVLIFKIEISLFDWLKKQYYKAIVIITYNFKSITYTYTIP